MRVFHMKFSCGILSEFFPPQEAAEKSIDAHIDKVTILFEKFFISDSYSFIPEREIPSTKYLCANRNNSMVGKTAIQAPAI